MESVPPKVKFADMEKINKIWFDDTRIWMSSNINKEYSRPLEAFPFLKLATKKARENYQIMADGLYLYWPEMDEYIEIDSFYDTAEPDTNNVVAETFRVFPAVDPRVVAKEMGIHYTLMYSLIYGMTPPTKEFMDQLAVAIRKASRP